MSFKTRIDRLRSQLDHPGEIRFTVFINSPEYAKQGVAMASIREAMIGCDYFAAARNESVQDFHARLREIAKAMGAESVTLGDPRNVAPVKKTLFDLSGKLLSEGDEGDEDEPL